MVDLSQFLTVGGLAVLLSLIVQFFKQYLPDTAKPWIPWLSVGLGIVLALGFGAASNLMTTQALVSLAVTGLLAGFSAVGLYQGTLNNLPKA
jgi:hypothetical protein